MVRKDFDRGTMPFAPLEQFMGVFPASWGKFLPPSWREPMMRDVSWLSLSVCLSLSRSLSLSLSLSFLVHLHPQNSPIIDFYPTKFKVDLNGKKWVWKGVALLPFVDERCLLQALSFVYPNLTAYEGQFVICILYYLAEIYANDVQYRSQLIWQTSASDTCVCSAYSRVNFRHSRVPHSHSSASSARAHSHSSARASVRNSTAENLLCWELVILILPLFAQQAC